MVWVRMTSLLALFLRLFWGWFLVVVVVVVVVFFVDFFFGGGGVFLLLLLLVLLLLLLLLLFLLLQILDETPKMDILVVQGDWNAKIGNEASKD